MKTTIKFKQKFMQQFIIGLMVLMVIACTEEDVKPTVQMVYKIDNENPFKVIFNCLLTDTEAILWDFGDGTTSTLKNPIYSYAEKGEYTVTLTATSADIEAVSTKTVVIEGVFEPIMIENGDFQLPGDVKHGNWSEVPGWNSDTEATDSGVEGGGDSWSGFLKSSDPTVYNLSDHVISEAEKIKVEMNAWDIWNAPKFTISLYYDSGDGTRNVIESKTFDIVAGQVNDIEFATIATAESVGANLGIEFANESLDGSDGWSGFDNVQLLVK